jgi:antitoxin ParD1/3/4
LRFPLILVGIFHTLGPQENKVMAHVEKISVALTPELATVMRQVVESGEYASVSEVMREALRDWKFRRTQRQQAIDELRRQWNEGLESGAAEDGEEVFARMKRRLETVSAQ